MIKGIEKTIYNDQMGIPLNFWQVGTITFSNVYNYMSFDLQGYFNQSSPMPISVETIKVGGTDLANLQAECTKLGITDAYGIAYHYLMSTPQFQGGQEIMDK